MSFEGANSHSKERTRLLISEGSYGEVVNEVADWMRLLKERVFGGFRAPGIDTA